nr:phospholipase D-like domain-containing protein [Actinomyces sp. Z3]
MGRAGLGMLERERTVAVLRAIEGALAHPTSVTPVWTVPGGPGAFGVTGHLTGLIHELVTRAGEDGKRPRNHAKFVVVDHQIVVVTSANMSRSAEERNVELGLRLDEPLLARAIEDQMRALEPHVYERVAG